MRNFDSRCLLLARTILSRFLKFVVIFAAFLPMLEYIYDILLLLPEDLQIFIVRPRDLKNNKGTASQTRKDFKVRQAVIEQWLLYLCRRRGDHPWDRGRSRRREKLIADATEVSELRKLLGLLGTKTAGRQPRCQPHINMPTPRLTPISSSTTSHLSLAGSSHTTPPWSCRDSHLSS